MLASSKDDVAAATIADSSGGTVFAVFTVF